MLSSDWLRIPSQPSKLSDPILRLSESLISAQATPADSRLRPARLRYQQKRLPRRLISRRFINLARLVLVAMLKHTLALREIVLRDL